MLLESLREKVLHANREIARRGLAPHTFGNASGIDRPAPSRWSSSSPAASTTPRSRPLTWWSPSSTARSSKAPCAPRAISIPTRFSIRFPQIGGIVHTHSEFATSWAQACRPIPCLGTTHADYFHGPVPVTEPLTAAEVAEGLRPQHRRGHRPALPRGQPRPVAVPGVLVAGHAPFAWGKNAAEAVEHADVLEYIARLAFRSVLLGAPEAGIPVYVRTPLPAQARSESHIRPKVNRRSGTVSATPIAALS